MIIGSGESLDMRGIMDFSNRINLGEIKKMIRKIVE